MSIIFYLRFELTTIKTMMNCEIIYNFISQIKIKKLNFQKNVNVLLKLKILNDIYLKCYKEYFLRIKIMNANEHEIRIK
jgi:antirestriction protein